MITGRVAQSTRCAQHSWVQSCPRPTVTKAASPVCLATGQRATSQTCALEPLLPDEVWYFAYGSNMNPKALTGRRMVRPRQSLPCRVPDHKLSFAVLGFPYSEPGFATVVQCTQPQQQQSLDSWQRNNFQQYVQQRSMLSAVEHSSGCGPCVHGVLHRITKREWAFVQATEGVGSGDVGYQVITVSCLLYDGQTTVEAQSLKSAAASMHSSHRQALPSQRYLQLLQEGARHHQLDPVYQQWLNSLQSYQSANILQQTVGTMASGAVLAAAAAPAVPVYVASRALGLLPKVEEQQSSGSSSSRGDIGVVPFLSWYANQAQNMTWWVHDNVMSSVLGSGCSNETQ